MNKFYSHFICMLHRNSIAVFMFKRNRVVVILLGMANNFHLLILTSMEIIFAFIAYECNEVNIEMYAILIES